MSITKYLCKKFDKNNNGYVTLEDVMNKIFTDENICKFILNTLICIVLSSVFCLLGEFYNYGLGRVGTVGFFNLISISNWLVGAGIIIIIWTVLKVLDMSWNAIKTSKIAVCPLKENK